MNKIFLKGRCHRRSKDEYKKGLKKEVTPVVLFPFHLHLIGPGSRDTDSLSGTTCSKCEMTQGGRAPHSCLRKKDRLESAKLGRPSTLSPYTLRGLSTKLEKDTVYSISTSDFAAYMSACCAHSANDTSKQKTRTSEDKRRRRGSYPTPPRDTLPPP